MSRDRSSMASDNVLQTINRELEDGWEAKLSSEGRLYYTNHKTQSTSWIPPKENWDPSTGLPYGWETGVDKNNKPYFINHVEKYTTRDDPRDDIDYIEPPKPRQVQLLRDPEKGFGFVAGSEKPVVVRFVTEGGPSVDKLLPGDLILKINSEEVRKAPREKVIELVRACKQSIVLTVCQPYSDNSSIKSALLTAAKKAKLKSNPSRVRFAESVMVNGNHVLTPSIQESYVPFMPNVLKVFLENGQTKSFKYDNKTTVGDVMLSLHEKLNITCTQYFSLVLQNMKNNTAGKMTLLQDAETLIDIAARPGARHFRCLYRVTFVPKDAYDLLKEDSIAFEYFYLQCCNDIVNERFASELKYDNTLRLAALQIQQHAITNNMAGKISIKTIEKEFGFDKFVPRSLLEYMKGKDLRKMLSQYLKQNQSLAAPGQKNLTALQAKLHYMKIVSELKTFGSRVFMVTLLDKKCEAMVLVGPKSGISVVTNIKTYQMGLLADFDQIGTITVTKEGDNMQRVDINTKEDPIFGSQTISLGLLTEDAQNFVCMVEGYYKIFVNNDKNIVERTQGKNTSDPDVLAYSNVHRVVSAPWAYPEDLVSEVIYPGESGEIKSDNERLVDLSKSPPDYVENKDFMPKVEIKKSEDELLISTKADIEISPLPSPKLNGNSYEESVTSFGANSHDDSSDTSSLNTSQNDHTFTTFKGNSSHPLVNGSTSDKKPSILTNDHSYLENSSLALRSDEAPSDTDSGSGIDMERKPLISSTALQNGDVRNGFDVESDDTDSWGTPQDSPAKPRFGHVQPSLPLDNFHSFGLHSPDVPPGTDINVEDFAASMGLPVSDTIDNPDINLLEPQGVYLDPDIIDLTLIPPPISSDEESMIDFTMLSANSSFNSSTSKLGAGNSPPITSIPYNRLNRSISCEPSPDLRDDNNIDDFIARLIVRPPPASDTCSSVNSSLVSQDSDNNNTLSKDWKDNSASNLLEDDFLKLIIPPPPTSNTSHDEELPIVPPINEAKQRRKMFRHKRSSSVDIGSLQKAKELLFAKSHSMDSKHSSESASKTAEPPASFDGEFYPVTGTVAESPATVSDKLNKLLESLPRVGSIENFVRTGSLKLSRSSSFDTVAKDIPPQPFVRTSSLRSVKSPPPVPQRSSSLDIKPKATKIAALIPKAHSFDSVKVDSKDSTSNMASIKAKLQSCRDMLLTKSKFSKRPSIDSDCTSDSDSSENVTRKGSLKRSNSFTKLIDQLSKHRNSSSSSSPVLTKHFTQESTQEVDKKTPSVLETIPLPKTLRPVSTSSSSQQLSVFIPPAVYVQSKSKKTGPVKALGTSVYATNETSVTSRGKKEEKSKKTKKHGSKDDSLMDTSGKIKWKANPYATIKMWRPITMSTSITSEEDVYQSFNFQNPNDISDNIQTKEQSFPLFQTTKNGNVEYPVKIHSHHKQLSISIPEEETSLPSTPPRACGKVRSISENSHNIVSNSAMDIVKEIMDKVYTTSDFEQANSDVDSLLVQLKFTLAALPSSQSNQKSTEFDNCLDALITKTKQFINDAKLLVSSANNTHKKLAHYLTVAMHTLAGVFLHSQSFIIMLESAESAQNIGQEVVKVCHAFKNTVTASQTAVGKTLSDPQMKYLMRQAHNLAGVLSILLKDLKTVKTSL